MKKQQKIMNEKINRSKADWKIVYGHHPWRSIGGHGDAEEDLEQFFTDLYVKSPFDLYMCGHDHNKQVIMMNIMDNQIPLIVCGTGGKVYDDINDKFYYFVIPQEAVTNVSNLEIVFETFTNTYVEPTWGEPKRFKTRGNGFKKWWNWEVGSFEEMACIVNPISK